MEKKHPHAGSALGSINTVRVNKLIRQLIKVWDNDTPTDNIVDQIQRQDWPNIFIKDNGEHKGRGVFTGILGIKMGTIVCDYHGDLIKGSEGEKRMKKYPMEDRSFMMFVKPTKVRYVSTRAVLTLAIPAMHFLKQRVD